MNIARIESAVNGCGESYIRPEILDIWCAGKTGKE
jgi:hypothetical protein